MRIVLWKPSLRVTTAPRTTSPSRTSGRSRKPSDALVAAVMSERGLKRRSDKETSALAANFDLDDEPGPPKKVSKKQQFSQFDEEIDVRMSLKTSSVRGTFPLGCSDFLAPLQSIIGHSNTREGLSAVSQNKRKLKK